MNESGERKPEQAPALDININKERLNEIIRASSEQGALIGKQVILDDADKQDFRAIADAIDAHLRSQMGNDPDWQEFQKISGGLFSKGELMSGVFPPSWLINGGPSAKVSSFHKPGEGMKITVPEKVFNAYYWEIRAEQLKKAQYLPDTSAKYLAQDLRDAAHFLKEIGKL